MPVPRRRITQDGTLELLADWRASEQPLPEWGAENGVDASSLRYWADRLPQPAAIRLVELARPGRTTPEPLRLTRNCVVIDVPDGFSFQLLRRVLAVVRVCWPSAHAV